MTNDCVANQSFSRIRMIYYNFPVYLTYWMRITIFSILLYFYFFYIHLFFVKYN